MFEPRLTGRNSYTRGKQPLGKCYLQSWPTFSQSLLLDVKQQHFPRMEHFCCLKITLSRNFCSLDLVRPPFLRITPVNQIYSYPLKDEIKLYLAVDKSLKTHPQGYFASGKLINFMICNIYPCGLACKLFDRVQG